MNKSLVDKKKSISSKKRNTIVLAFLGVAVLGIIFASAWPQFEQIVKEQKQFDIVAKVNDVEVAQGEFKIFLNKVTSDTFSYFANKYNVVDQKGYWTKSFNGEVPEQVAKKKAMELVKEIKVEQSLLIEKGLMETWGYKKFLDNLAEENRKRKETLARGGIIYGPQKFDLNNYYSYVYSDLVNKLKEKLQEKELKIEDKELLDYYNIKKNSDDIFKKPDYIKIQYIEFKWEAGKSSSNQSRDKAIKDANSTMDELKRGASFEQQMMKNNEKGEIKERVFDETTNRSDVKEDEGLYQSVKSLETGRISDILESGASFYIVKCVERKSNGIQTYEEAKEEIRNTINVENYKKYINKLINEAKVEVNDSVYNKIRISE